MTSTDEQRGAHRTKSLAWIAAGGLGVGALGLGLIALFTAGDLSKFPVMSFYQPSCGAQATLSDASERNFKWGGEDTVDIALPSDVTVHYRGGEGDEVIVRGSPRDIAQIEVANGEIRSTCRGSFARKVDVTLPGRVFRQVSLKGSGKMIMEAVNQHDLDVTVAGSGSIYAQGQINTASISIAGSGEVKLADLAIENLTASIAGSGTVDAAPQAAAEINITGSGEVRLLSRPADMNANILGSGRVTYMPGS